MVTLRRSPLFTKKYKANHDKIPYLYALVFDEKDPKTVYRKQLQWFIDAEDKDESLRQFGTIQLQHYSYASFDKWLSSSFCLDYVDGMQHSIVSLDLLEAGMDNLFDNDAWVTLLEGIATGEIATPKKPCDLRFVCRALPALVGPVVAYSTPVTNIALIETPEVEYSVQKSQDEDYGAVDESYIDTQVGSYNTGNSDSEWQQCIGFFRVPPAPLSVVTASKPSSKRVPIAKIPGMSVGLFDYQLMGVFKLLSLAQSGLTGGFLADEQGLGKTQEMFGLIAASHNLRKCKSEVMAVLKSGKPTRHHAPDKTATTCPLEGRYGMRCYCYSKVTQALADALPEGPTVIIVPASSCAQTLREAKTKLNIRTLKVRLHHETATQQDKLTPAEIKSLTASVSTRAATDGTIEYRYQSSPGLSDFIIITTPESLSSLTNGIFGSNINVGNERKKRDVLLPGLVMLDEFHEYLQNPPSATNKTLSWLMHLKKSCRGADQPAPNVYFISGTPFGGSPSDIRPAISYLEQPEWTDSHPMATVTTSSLDAITTAFDILCTAQSGGLELNRDDIINYRRQLDRLLNLTMVRRLGTDSFRSQPLTNLGPLRVNIIDHPAPTPFLPSLQLLATSTSNLITAAAATHFLPIPRFLRTPHAEPFLLKLRLASTFPGISHPSATPFTFTTSEATAFLSSSSNNPTLTPYYPHLPLWSSNSPKLTTLSQTITTMLTDTSPIPGESSSAKKLVIFTPLEAETCLIHAYLLHRKTSNPITLKNLKPVSIHSGMAQAERQGVIDKFLKQGNAPPNVLVAPMALAGTGLNLQRAGYCVVMGPAWTKREVQQAYYRIHRVGQKGKAKLSLLMGKWNPGEKAVLGMEVGEGEGGWDVAYEETEGEREGGLVERHQIGEQ